MRSCSTVSLLQKGDMRICFYALNLLFIDNCSSFVWMFDGHRTIINNLLEHNRLAGNGLDKGEFDGS